MSKMEVAVFDENGTSPRDRFMLMLMDRVQALETSVSLLEAESMTDSMSIVLDVDSLSDSINTINSMFGGRAMRGSSEPPASDWPAFAARFGQAVERIGGVDVSEVLVEHVRPAKVVRTVNDIMQGGLASMDFSSMMQDILERVSSTRMFMTVRLRSKQSTAALTRKLFQALDEQRAVKVNGSWRPTDVSAARLSSRNALDQITTWTWTAKRSDETDERRRTPPTTPGVDPATDVYRFALMLIAAMMTIGGGAPAANHGQQ